jgi:hypothetical protein
MVDQGQNFGLEQWIVDLAAIAGEAERRAFLSGRAAACDKHSVDSLYDAVVIFARVDLQKADRPDQRPLFNRPERPCGGSRSVPDREIPAGYRRVRKGSSDF